MRTLQALWVTTVTRNDANAGTRNLLTLTAHADGGDAIKYEFPADTADDQAQGQADLYRLDQASIRELNTDPIPEDKLLRAEFRIGVNGTDAWRPEHVFLWGELAGDGEAAEGPTVIALAGEMGMDVRLSLSGTRWKALSRLAGGGPETDVRRLLVVMTTELADNGSWFWSDYLTNTVRLKIGTASGQMVVNEPFPRTCQAYFKTGRDNCFIFPLALSVRKSQLIKEGVLVHIDGPEVWRPASFFVFGLDSLAGQPSVMVPLACLPAWTAGCLSQDTAKGQPWAAVPLA